MSYLESPRPWACHRRQTAKKSRREPSHQSLSKWLPHRANPPIRALRTIVPPTDAPRGTPAMKILPPVSIEARRLLPSRWDLLAAALVLGFIVAFADTDRKRHVD